MNIITRHPKFFWTLILFLVVGSLVEMYPLSNQNLIDKFNDEASVETRDAKFRQIVDEARKAQQANPDPAQEFTDLNKAIGTNDITKYFPLYLSVTQGKRNPTYAILNALQRRAEGKMHLGIDLQGGTEYIVSLDTNHMVADTNHTGLNPAEESERLVSQAISILRNRVDALGVAEPILTPEGGNRISIQLPGLSQAQQDEAERNITNAAFLEFRIVNPKAADFASEKITPPGFEWKTMTEPDPNTGQLQTFPILVGKTAAEGLTGKYVTRAYANRDMSGNPEVDFELNSVGAEKFAKLTTEHVGEQMAIVLDGEVKTAPTIRGPITGGRCSISGGSMDYAEAISEASMLENPLETPVHIEAVNKVAPTLGEDSIHSGVRAALVGTLFVVVFMAVYYHRCGMIADIAMVLNLVITLGIMCSIGSTLSLPGIAGVALTVGMAVDANVLIYERLREELVVGKSVKGALSAAYSRAFGTIFDSHTTTLVSAVVLIFMGTGPVKGFGITLTIGVALSLFTSLVVTRLVFDFLLNRNWLNKIGMLHLIKNPHWDFMKWNTAAYVLSGLLILAGAVSVISRGSNVLGPDFAGGDSITLTLKSEVSLDKLRPVVDAAVGAQSQLGYEKNAGGEILKSVVPYGKAAAATNALAGKFPEAGFNAVSINEVGPSVGQDITRSAVFASFLSLFLILFYVALRYEFSFSVGAVLAVFHDVFLTLGIFFISGRRLNETMVAAVLTIIGFSLNDKVVIFDRIREDLKLGVRGSFREVINKAVNQTLSRTIITSGTVFLSTFSLYWFGGDVINDFAFTFLVGIICGTYSSIYIACALVLWWHKGQRPSMATPGAATTSEAGASAAPARV